MEAADGSEIAAVQNRVAEQRVRCRRTRDVAKLLALRAELRGQRLLAARERMELFRAYLWRRRWAVVAAPTESAVPSAKPGAMGR